MTETTRILVPSQPSLPMLVAGKKALYRCADDPELADVYAVWNAMMAALKEFPDAD